MIDATSQSLGKCGATLSIRPPAAGDESGWQSVSPAGAPKERSSPSGFGVAATDDGQPGQADVPDRLESVPGPLERRRVHPAGPRLDRFGLVFRLGGVLGDPVQCAGGPVRVIDKVENELGLAAADLPQLRPAALPAAGGDLALQLLGHGPARAGAPLPRGGASGFQSSLARGRSPPAFRSVRPGRCNCWKRLSSAIAIGT